MNLEKFKPEMDALLKVPFQVAARLHVVPLLQRDNTLIVALEDPSAHAKLAEIEFVTQCKIVPVLAQHSQIDWAIRDLYANIGADVGHHAANMSSEPPSYEMESIDSIQLVADLEADRDSNNREEDRTIEQSDNSLVRLINTMIVGPIPKACLTSMSSATRGAKRSRSDSAKMGPCCPIWSCPTTIATPWWRG